MQEVKAGSRLSRAWRRNRDRIISAIVVAIVCVAVTGSTAGVGIGTCTVAL